MSDLWSFLHRRSIPTLLRGLQRYVFGKRGQRRVAGLRLLTKLQVEMLLRTRHPHPFLPLTRARLWVDTEAFPRIEKLLRRARHTIVIQMFIWKDDALGRRIAGILLDAADTGVNVHISKETVGDIFEFRHGFLATRDEQKDSWKRFWNHPRIKITHDAHDDHGKVFIIDGRILLLTGMNIASEYHERWHDYLVELRGRCFALQYLSGEEPAGSPGSPIRLVMNTDRAKTVRPVLRQMLTAARASIVIEHAYFSDPEMTALLARRSHDGVRVIVILSEVGDFHFHANMQAASELMAKGNSRNLHILVYPKMIHGKIVLVDRAIAFVGSANLIASSLDQMGEVNVLIEGRHRRFVRRLREILRRDILQSRTLTKSPGSWMGKWLALLRL